MVLSPCLVLCVVLPTPGSLSGQAELARHTVFLSTARAAGNRDLERGPGLAGQGAEPGANEAGGAGRVWASFSGVGREAGPALWMGRDLLEWAGP